MKYEALHISADANDDFWIEWAASVEANGGGLVRSLAPGEEKVLIGSSGRSGSYVAVVTFAENPVARPMLCVDRRRIALQSTLAHPLLCVAAVDLAPASRIAITSSAGSQQPLLVRSFHLLPLPGAVSMASASALARLWRRLAPGGNTWREADFPYSHFDGVKYLQWNPDVRNAVLDRKCRSGLYHYRKFGIKEGRGLPLAVSRPPNPGSPLNLAVSLRENLLTTQEALRDAKTQSKTKAVGLEARIADLQQSCGESREENDLLLLQLHQVQEELEQYFLDNRKLRERQQELAEMEKHHQDLVTRHAALVTSEKDLATRHSSIAMALEEIQGTHSSLVAERDKLQARVKEFESAAAEAVKERDTLKKTVSDRAMALEEIQAKHSSLVAERDKLQARVKELESAAAEAFRERDTLKKTVSDRAIRIAELETLVADHASRQAQIDEELAKAEGQLEMLKELLRPTLT
jgi:hypothetical protein